MVSTWQGKAVPGGAVEKLCLPGQPGVEKEGKGAKRGSTASWGG